MSDPVHAAARQGFAKEAATYAHGRPGYPLALQHWLRATLELGSQTTVADVGAGTGKFTSLLAATGAGVVAVEPVAAMRARIASAGGVRILAGTAQALPLADGSLDAIVCAQAFHWFANHEALSEFARVLKPGGRLGLVWNVRDESVDWVAELTRIVAPYEGDAPRFASGAWRRAFPHPAFGALEEVAWPHVHAGPPEQVIIERFLSVSFVAALPAARREEVRADLEALIASHPALRGHDMVRFPYRTQAFACVRH